MPQNLDPSELKNNPTFMSMPLEKKMEVVGRGVPQFGSLDTGKKMEALGKAGLIGSEDIKGYAQSKQQGHPLVKIQQGGAAPIPPTATDKFAGFINRNNPVIGGAIGGVAGGMFGGLPGAVAGATAGGGLGGAIKKASEPESTGSEIAKEAGKQAAIQGGTEFIGGMAAKGIAKTAELLGVKEAMMKFVLKRGEDFSKGTNPAAMMNKYSLRANTTKQLYQATTDKIGSLNAQADAMLAKRAASSPTVNTNAIAKSVYEKYRDRAIKAGDDKIVKAMNKMIATLPSAPSGNVSISEANALRREVWKPAVKWDKEPAKNSIEAAFQAVQSARREIYTSINDSIADSMGGAEGQQWRATNSDISQLMEAQAALNEAGKRTTGEASKLVPTVLDLMRNKVPAIHAAIPETGNVSGKAFADMIRTGQVAGTELTSDK